MLMIQETGGAVSDMDGKDLDLKNTLMSANRGIVACTSPDIHRIILDIIHDLRL